MQHIRVHEWKIVIVISGQTPKSGVPCGAPHLEGLDGGGVHRNPAQGGRPAQRPVTVLLHVLRQVQGYVLQGSGFRFQGLGLRQVLGQVQGYVLQIRVQGVMPIGPCTKPFVGGCMDTANLFCPFGGPAAATPMRCRHIPSFPLSCCSYDLRSCDPAELIRG